MVWRATDGQILLWNGSTTTVVGQNAGGVGFPQIDGNTVVWSAIIDGVQQIFYATIP